MLQSVSRVSRVIGYTWRKTGAMNRKALKKVPLYERHECHQSCNETVCECQPDREVSSAGGGVGRKTGRKKQGSRQ